MKKQEQISHLQKENDGNSTMERKDARKGSEETLKDGKKILVSKVDKVLCHKEETHEESKKEDMKDTAEGRKGHGTQLLSKDKSNEKKAMRPIKENASATKRDDSAGREYIIAKEKF